MEVLRPGSEWTGGVQRYSAVDESWQVVVISNQGIGIWWVLLVETVVTGDSLTVPPPPGAAPDTLLQWRGRPRPLGLWWSGWFRWNLARREGSSTSSRSTQDLFSSPYPSQSIRYSRRPPGSRNSASGRAGGDADPRRRARPYLQDDRWGWKTGGHLQRSCVSALPDGVGYELSHKLSRSLGTSG